MASEKKMHDNWPNYLGPVAIAQFIDAGWIVEWPLCWTRGGIKAAKNGYGAWDESRQRLPFPDRCEPSPHGVVYWPDRYVPR